MPLHNYQYDTIMREYSRRQAQNRRIQEQSAAGPQAAFLHMCAFSII